ncbi:MAG: hypothetical protein ISP86_01760 [Shewanellaceae bacterium]|nr:hypothetical protein [Shewanellaceae bacterium]
MYLKLYQNRWANRLRPFQTKPILVLLKNFVLIAFTPMGVILLFMHVPYKGYLDEIIDYQAFFFCLTLLAVIKSGFNLYFNQIQFNAEDCFKKDFMNAMLCMEQLTDVVNEKVNRYQVALKQDDFDNLDDFVRYDLDPQEQISLLTNGIYQVFVSILNSGDFTVRAVLFENILKEPADIQPVKWLAYAPLSQPPIENISTLDDPFIIQAATKNELMVQEQCGSTHKYNTHQAKSCIYYPVDLFVDGNRVPVVIILASPHPKLFLKRKAQAYHWLLEQFGSRIRLECCLFYIQEARHRLQSTQGLY